MQPIVFHHLQISKGMNLMSKQKLLWKCVLIRLINSILPHKNWLKIVNLPKGRVCAILKLMLYTWNKSYFVFIITLKSCSLNLVSSLNIMSLKNRKYSGNFSNDKLVLYPLNPKRLIVRSLNTFKKDNLILVNNHCKARKSMLNYKKKPICFISKRYKIRKKQYKPSRPFKL